MDSIFVGQTKSMELFLCLQPQTAIKHLQYMIVIQRATSGRAHILTSSFKITENYGDELKINRYSLNKYNKLIMHKWKERIIPKCV